ncbi:MAG: SIR2 family protein, partial [Nitrospinales bacterium]
MSKGEAVTRFIEKRKPILWVGAGLSIQAGYPTIVELAEELWKEHATDPAPSGLGPYQLVDAFFDQYGRGELNQALSKLIPTGAQPRPAHRHIAKLAKIGFFSKVITTNYDRLIEKAFDENDVDYFLQILSSNQTIGDENRLRLIKLHGDVSDWKNAILTGESYHKFNRRYTFLKQQLNVLLRQNRVLFVGCSMLDERILEWIESLSKKDRDLLKSWMALLTKDAEERLLKITRPNGNSVYDIYQTISLRTEPHLPDHDTLTQWLGRAAETLVPLDGRPELTLSIHAGDDWQVRFSGSEQAVREHPLNNKEFLENLQLLEKIIYRPLSCDKSGNLRAEDAKVVSTIAELAAWIGDRLAAVLVEADQKKLAESMRQTDIPLFRVVVDGPQTDRVLALPWELIHVDGRFPVKESRIDLVREVVSPNGSELSEPDKHLRVLVHIAAPEDPEGIGALHYEEEAYRLVLSMQQAADEAVIFSDLGTLNDLTSTLQRTTPTVVHFTGHGAPGTLLFENDEGDEAPLEIEKMLAAMRAKAYHGQRALPPVFYLASCHGATSTHTSGETKFGFRQLSELGAVLGEGPSSAATLHREGSAAVLAYYGPVGDQLSTSAEIAIYQNLARGRPLTDAAREARQSMQAVLEESGQHYQYPLGWAQLALFLRGDDRPVSIGVPDAGESAALEQELFRPAKPIHALEIPEPGLSGFISRRKDMSLLRKQHRRGRRLTVLQGLGGVGKTALALNLIPKLGVPLDRIILIDASNLETTASASALLWNSVQEGIAKIEPEKYRKAAEKQRKIVDPASFFSNFVGDIRKQWLIYLDNAESLQKSPKAHKEEIGAWRDAEVAEFWSTIAGAAKHGGPLTFIATARYIWDELDPQNVYQVGALKPADILRMMRWFPNLRYLPNSMRPKIAKWLNGHARGLVYLEGILHQHFKFLRPEEVNEGQWLNAIETAMPITDEKLQTEDLLLQFIWKHISPEGQKHLKVLSALRRPVPAEAVRKLGNEFEDLNNFGLISHFSGKLMALHSTVSRFVEQQSGKPEREDHLAIGHWYRNAYKDDPTPDMDEETVYHLVNAEDGKAAAPIARRLADFYLTKLRYFDCARVLEDVSGLPIPEQETVDLLLVSGNLQQTIADYEKAKECFQNAYDISNSKKLRDETISSSLHGLANALSSQGKYDEAVSAYKKSLEIQKKVYGTENHPSYAASLHGLANALSSQGKYDEA